MIINLINLLFLIFIKMDSTLALWFLIIEKLLMVLEVYFRVANK